MGCIPASIWGVMYFTYYIFWELNSIVENRPQAEEGRLGALVALIYRLTSKSGKGISKFIKRSQLPASAPM
jgi:hypothetical protein